MAKIYYSLAGEGRGHATRVRSLVERLRTDHEITVFAPGTAYDFLRSAYDWSDVQVRRIPGLFFHYAGMRLNLPQTIWQGARYIGGIPRLIGRLEKRLRREQPDLVITDFEPSLPRAAARCGIPFISLDHQHFLLANDLSGLPLGLRSRARAMGQVVAAFYSGQCETIVSSFYFPPLRRGYEHVTQAGVLLRPEILQAHAEDRGHLLVYLRRHGLPNVLEALRKCGRDVRIYGLGERPNEGSLQFLAIDEENFLHDLATCTALISNAGNQLVGEAMYLGKPLLAMPETKNFEQRINAHFLRESGGGDWIDPELMNGNSLREFLDRSDDYRGQVDRDRLNGMPLVLQTIERHLPVRVPAPHSPSLSIGVGA